MILVDSSVWIDYFRGAETASTDHLDALLGSVPIAVGDLVVTEVLQGFREEKHFRTAQALLDELTLVRCSGTNGPRRPRSSSTACAAEA